MKKLYYIFLLVALSGCGDFLEEYSQDTYYVSSWEDLDELMIGSCYLPVKGAAELTGMSNPGCFLHFLADEIGECNTSGGSAVVYDTKERAFGFYTWQERFGQNDSYTDYLSEDDAWTQLYYCINVANNIIASAEEVPQVTKKERTGVLKVRGEAHFVRAFYYFWLVNLYGKPYDPSTAATDPGVPVKTSENVEDKKFQRQSVQEVYDLILSDLDVAEEAMTEALRGVKRVGIYRADSVSVHLLKSRVHLYMQNWTEAARYAKKVMDEHPALQDLTSSDVKFAVADNAENIFSMGGSDLPCLFNYAYQAFSVSQDLYNAYEYYDQRKHQWFWTMGQFVGPVKYAEGNKYTMLDKNSYSYYQQAYSYGLSGTLLPVSDAFLLRSAEAYLNYAEAEAYLGNEDEAREALNHLRRHRVTNESNSQVVTASGTGLYEAIRKERRLELALEGHRWFDLRRYNVCSTYPKSISITHDYTYYAERGGSQMSERHRFVLQENDPAYTLPIPENVIIFNTGMVQNERVWRDYVVIPVN